MTDQPSRLRYRSVREALDDGDLPDPPVGSGWGPWTLNHLIFALEMLERPDRFTYCIDLEQCTTSAEVLDWICQVAAKTWADDATLAGLVRALADVLHPQGTLCSSGQSRRLSKARIRQQVREVAEATRTSAQR
jgi:hypothetical protein